MTVFLYSVIISLYIRLITDPPSSGSIQITYFFDRTSSSFDLAMIT